MAPSRISFGLGLVLLLSATTLTAACKGKSARSKAKEALASKDFWPDAPPVTGADAASTLRYQPDNVGGYRLLIDVKSLPGSAASITADMTLGLAFRAGAAPRTRAGHINELKLNLDAAGQVVSMGLENEVLSMRADGQTMTFKRGEGGIFDVDKFLDEPFTTMTVSEDSKVTFAGNASHPMVALGGDMMDTALILFPDLPPGEVKPGATWNVTRDVALSSGMAHVTVRYDFRYLGTATCPSGPPVCAVLELQAESSTGTAEEDGVTVKVAYAFAGRIYFDTARGAVDQSRVYMHMDAKAQGMKVAIGGRYTLIPT